jgi:hypothetical protein
MIEGVVGQITKAISESFEKVLAAIAAVTDVVSRVADHVFLPFESNGLFEVTAMQVLVSRRRALRQFFPHGFYIIFHSVQACAFRLATGRVATREIAYFVTALR